DGIEIDRHGAPRAYWIRKTHPGDSYVYGASPDEWRRIRAETRWGRRRVIHAFNKERPGQNRGKPLFAPVVKQFKMLEKYQSSELQAAVINAMIAAFVETPMGAEDIAEMFGGGKDNFEQYVEDRAKFTENRVSLKAGAVLPMFPGDKVNPFTPTRPSDAFAPFVDAMNRHVATALNIPYELLLKDFSKTNYSSARAALLEAWRFFNGRRKWLSDSWAQPVYELWLEEAVGTGLVDLPDYYANHRAYARADWIGPGRGWVDPAKEAKAAQMRLDTGVSTLERECAEQGLDWQEVLQQRALEREYMRELGLLEAADAGALAPFPIESEDDNQQKPDGAGS
ncbi:MAG: phage portal protein, partial [bacterium]|nr:phage portal protein [bacterium]